MISVFLLGGVRCLPESKEMMTLGPEHRTIILKMCGFQLFLFLGGFCLPFVFGSIAYLGSLVYSPLNLG